MADRDRERRDLLRRWRKMNRPSFDWRGFVSSAFWLPACIAMVSALFFLPVIGTLRLAGLWPVYWGWVFALTLLPGVILGLVGVISARFQSNRDRKPLHPIFWWLGVGLGAWLSYVGGLTLADPTEPLLPSFREGLKLAIYALAFWFISDYFRLRREVRDAARRRARLS